MERSEVLQRVKEVVSDILGVPESDIVETDDFIADLGAESIQSLELVAAFEEEFDIEMDEEAALEVQSVGDAVDFISEYLED
ncbi:MAG: acyl carrier protein [Candidatus Brocadiia bacterium]|nr:acyl carrier protein [Planctomycetota bacterium]